MNCRISTAILALSLLLLLDAYYYLNHELHEEYPGNEEVIRGVEGLVSIGGQVSGTFPGGFHLLIKHGSERIIVGVLSDINVSDGDMAEVLGTLRDGEIIPDKIIVQENWACRSIFLRSMLAVPIVLYLFFRSWTFDFRKMGFRRREGA